MKRIIYTEKDFRILEIYDEFYSLEDLKGDCFNPEVNNDLNPELLIKEEKEFENLVDNSGVFGYVLEKWNTEVDKGWEHLDSCWGFVGSYNLNNEKFNHYIVDEMINELKGHIKFK